MANFKRPTTVDLIANGKYPNAPAGTIIETLGYTAKGDGGGAAWKKTGVTGLTVSQSPAQLVDGKLTDANGHEWELSETSVNIRYLGAVGNAVSDDTASIQAGITCAQTSSKVLFIPSGDFLHATLVITSGNLHIRGESRATAVLRYSAATGESFTISDAATTLSNIYIESLWFAQSAGVERVSGSVIQWFNMTHSGISDCYFTDVYKGVEITGAARSEIKDLWFRQETGRVAIAEAALDLKYNTTTALGLSNLKIIRVDGVCSSPTSGWVTDFIKLNTADWVLFDQCHVNLALNGLLIDTSNNILDLRINDSYFDQAFNNNVRTTGSASVNVYNLRFVETYFRFPTNRNVSFDQTSLMRNVTFDSCIFEQSGTDGVFTSSENIERLDIANCAFLNGATSAVGNAITSKALRTRINGTSFDNFVGPYDVTCTRAVSSGSLLIGACTFSGSAATTAKLLQSNIAIVNVENNIALSTTLVPLLEAYSTTGVTTDGSGLATIAHGLSTIPVWATADLWNSTAERANVVSVDATNITVFLSSEVDNSPIATATRNVRWIAKA